MRHSSQFPRLRPLANERVMLWWVIAAPIGRAIGSIQCASSNFISFRIFYIYYSERKAGVCFDYLPVCLNRQSGLASFAHLPDRERGFPEVLFGRPSDWSSLSISQSSGSVVRSETKVVKYLGGHGESFIWLG